MTLITVNRRLRASALAAFIAIVLGSGVVTAILGPGDHHNRVAANRVIEPPSPRLPSATPPPAASTIAVLAGRVLHADTPLAAVAVPQAATRLVPVALLLAPHPIPASFVAAVSRLTGVSTTPVGAAGFTVAGQRVNVLSVDPAWLRSASPAPSADSDPLWASIARGDLVASYEGKGAALGVLGNDVTAASGSTHIQLRLGARAGFGLTDADFIVSPARGEQIGLIAGSGLLVAAVPGANSAILAEQLAPIARAAGIGYALMGVAAANTSVSAGSGTWVGLFQRAATTCSGLPWQVLASIGQIESDDGRNDGPSSAGAVGPMQFLPSTFAAVAVDGNHDGKVSPLDPYDAVYSAARLLCEDGAGNAGSLPSAIFAYNHAQWYVDEVLALAKRY